MRAFLRTGLLCAAAGSVLYLGLAAFAERARQPHLWLALAIGGAGLALMSWQILDALRSGEVNAGRFVVYRRDSRPVGFWLSVGFISVMGLCLVAVLARAAWLLANAAA